MSHAPLVHLVGAGPGAADLLTVRAARLIAGADIVLHDALVDAEVLALAPSAARMVPVGKRCGRLSSAQAFINKQLIDAAYRYRTVVRLKGGDPMLFGRAQEEIESLAEAGVSVNVVPGVSAAFGAAAALQQSLTQRGMSRSVCFLTPAVGRGEQDHDWARPAVNADTAVLYMASRQAQAITDGLLAAGIPASRPAVLVESATLAGERVIVTQVGGLSRAAAELGDGPVLMMIGDVYASLALRETHAEQVAQIRGAA
jgi:uroporphyrin-III C-methyltransferase